LENTKLVLLWLDFEQELNTKDIEDFFFPMGIDTSSYDQWFRRYVLLEVDECCWNSALDRFGGD
jgi:hypothetical protein